MEDLSGGNMASESESNLRLKIGHVLFIDLVGYSKLLIDEQKERLLRIGADSLRFRFRLKRRPGMGPRSNIPDRTDSTLLSSGRLCADAIRTACISINQQWLRITL